MELELFGIKILHKIRIHGIYQDLETYSEEEQEKIKYELLTKIAKELGGEERAEKNEK